MDASKLHMLSAFPLFSAKLRSFRSKILQFFFARCIASVSLNYEICENLEKDAQRYVNSLRGFQHFEHLKTAVQSERPGILFLLILALVAQDTTVMVFIATFILQNLAFTFYWTKS